MIRFQNVTKKYHGPVHALSEVSVEIQDGDFVFLIGSSGAGKTTFLRLLIRDLLPSHGEIFLDDINIPKTPKHKIHIIRRKVATIFQDFKLLSDRTIFENIALGLEILGKKDKEIAKRVTDMLALVRLADKKDQFPMQLSAGELQRVAIARAIVGGPKVLLADEPTGNLDPETSNDIMQIFEQIHTLGTTIIMATHNAHIVNESKKRTIVLHHGSIVSDEAKGRYRLPSREKEEKNKDQDDKHEKDKKEK